jgi:hypothetical protein
VKKIAKLLGVKCIFLKNKLKRNSNRKLAKKEKEKGKIKRSKKGLD